MKMIKRAAVLAVTLMLVLACSAQAQVLQQVPSDALLVLKVNNLKATNDKVAKLAQDLGIAAMLPPAANPLAFLQAQLKMQQGLNTAGDMAFVMRDPVIAGGDTQKSMLILVPVSDYKAFLGNWPDAKTTGDISEAKFGTDTAYFANWGQYAAISPGKEAISAKPTAGLTAPSVTARELASKDIIFYANFTALRGKLLPDLQQVRPQLLNQMDQALRGNAQVAKFSPVLKVIVNGVLNIAEEFLNDTQAASIGLSITPAGINTTVMAEFLPGSYIATNVTAMKNTDAPLLAGLPTGKYLVYGGGVNDPVLGAKMLGDMLDPIIKELVAVGPEMAPALDYANAIKAASAAAKSQAFGLVAPSGVVGQDAILQFVIVQTGDTKVLADSYAKMMTSTQQIMKAANVPGMNGVAAVLTPKAKTIDGVTFDSVATKITPAPGDPTAAQQAQMMALLYGPQGAVQSYGAVGDKMLMVSGVSDKIISSAIAAAKAGTAPVEDAENVKAVAAQLPKQRISVIYVGVGDIVTTSLAYAKQFGLAMPLQLPPDLPPVGMTISTEDGTAIRIDTHIPTPLVQSLIAAGLQMQMQMQAAPAPGGGL